MANLSRGLKDPKLNRFLVKNNEGITPSLFQIDNISNTLSNIPFEGNDSSHVASKIDKKFSSPQDKKPEPQKRFDLVYQNDCESRITSE